MIIMILIAIFFSLLNCFIFLSFELRIVRESTKSNYFVLTDVDMNVW